MQSPTKKQKKDDSTTKIVGYLVSNVKLNGWNKWSIKTKPEEVVTVFLNNEESWMKDVLNSVPLKQFVKVMAPKDPSKGVYWMKCYSKMDISLETAPINDYLSQPKTNGTNNIGYLIKGEIRKTEFGKTASNQCTVKVSEAEEDNIPITVYGKSLIDQLENGPMQVIGTPPTGKDGRYQFWSGPNCEASIFNTNHALPFKIDEMQATKSYLSGLDTSKCNIQVTSIVGSQENITRKCLRPNCYGVVQPSPVYTDRLLCTKCNMLFKSEKIRESKKWILMMKDKDLNDVDVTVSDEFLNKELNGDLSQESVLMFFDSLEGKEIRLDSSQNIVEIVRKEKDEEAPNKPLKTKGSK